VWLIGAVVCLLAANRGSNCSFTRAMDGCVVHCGIISSCKSAATCPKIVKAFLVLSPSHVRSTIASTEFTFYLCSCCHIVATHATHVNSSLEKERPRAPNLNFSLKKDITNSKK